MIANSFFDAAALKAPGGGAIDPITPSDLSNLSGWWKADAITGLSDADPISSWPDSSGNGKNATTSGSNRPLYKTGILNSLPGVLFDNVDDALATTCVVGATNTVFLVYSGHADGGFHRAIQGQNNWLIGPWNDLHRMYNGAFINGPAVVDNVPVYATTRRTNTPSNNIIFRVNGTQIGSNTQSTSALNLGFGIAGLSEEPLHGYVFEVVAYSVPLTDDEILGVELYLVEKWGL